MKLTESERKRINAAMYLDNIIHKEPLMVIDDVRVLYAPKMMKAARVYCCGTTTITVLDWKFKIIMYDDHFMKLSDTAKDVVINHEMGHIQNGDIDTKKRSIVKQLLCGMRDMIFPKEEFLADLNAVRNVGFDETVSGLEEAAREVGSSKIIMGMMKRIFALKVYHFAYTR